MEDVDLEGNFPNFLKPKEIKKKMEELDSGLILTAVTCKKILNLIKQFCVIMIKSGCEVAEAANSRKLKDNHLYEVCSRQKNVQVFEGTILKNYKVFLGHLTIFVFLLINIDFSLKILIFINCVLVLSRETKRILK